MADFFLHQKNSTLPSEPYHRLTTLEAELFEQTENQVWLWERWTNGPIYEPSEPERVRSVMEAASQHPEFFLPPLKALHEVITQCEGEEMARDAWGTIPGGSDEEMQEEIRAVSQEALAKL